MNNLKILSLCLGVFLFVSCKQTKKEIGQTENSNWKFEKLVEDKTLYSDNDSSKEGMKITLEFNLPIQHLRDSTLTNIKSAFIIAFAGEEYKSMSPQKAFDSFLKKNIEEGIELGKLAKDDGADFSHYLKDISTSVFDTTSVTITARTYSEEYAGGAHGSHQITYYNIDIKTGKILNEKDIFKSGSEKELEDLLKESLQEMIQQGKSLTILEPAKIKPNGNFYFDKENLVYVFNEYEIAPYSDGIIEIRIPNTKISSLVDHKYQGLLKENKK